MDGLVASRPDSENLSVVFGKFTCLTVFLYQEGPLPKQEQGLQMVPRDSHTYHWRISSEPRVTCRKEAFALLWLQIGPSDNWNRRFGQVKKKEKLMYH